MKVLEEILENIDNSVEDLIILAKESIETHGIYTFDLYCTAILNRSINLLRGFTILMRDRNFIAAAPLLRVHLDSLLRLYASTLISYNVDDFAAKVINGKQISNLKDKDHNKMSDGYLARKISKRKGFEWVNDVYKAGSGYVHFSNYIIRSSTKINSENERTILSTVGKHDDFISDEEKIGAANRVNQISIFIAIIITEWKVHKEGYPAKTPKTTAPGE